MVSFLVVLKSGGDYYPEHVISLMRQVKRNVTVPYKFVCLTDIPINNKYIFEVPLETDWPGWWACVEMTRIVGPVIATGLDTIIIGNINRLFELALTCPEDVFYMTRPQPKAIRRGEKYCSGIMMWNYDWSWLYKEFNPSFIKQFKGEQNYTTDQLIKHNVDIRLTQDYFNGFYGFKQETKRGKNLPADAKFIGFHGQPRPWDSGVDWVMEAYDNEFIPPMQIEKEGIEI